MTDVQKLERQFTRLQNALTTLPLDDATRNQLQEELLEVSEELKNHKTKLQLNG